MKNSDIIKAIPRADDAPADPFSLFRKWLEDAENAEPRDANAMCLSTLDPDGRIGSRMVLLKELDDEGFVFYTNRDSRKGVALKANPFAALNFYWKSLGRQVRIEGPVMPTSDQASDAYYASRPRGSRIGAWASQQSRPLETRAVLEQKVAALEEQYEGSETIPRPPYWGGYIVMPDSIEFWHEGEFRLHSRVLYKKDAKGWSRTMLAP